MPSPADRVDLIGGALRIAVVCPYGITVPGGVQTQVLGLTRALRGLGHDAQLLAPCDGPPPERFITPLGRSMPFSVNGSRAPLAPQPAALVRTVRALRDGDFDVINVHEPVAPGVPMAVLLQHAVPIVGTFHAAGHRTPYRWFGRPLRSLARRIDVRVAVSPEAKALAERYLDGTYEVIANAVDVPAEVPRRDDAAAPTILFLGRHEPRKGLSVLLDAMTRLPAGVRLWVGGDGPETNDLRRRAELDDRIVWLGGLSERDKAERLRACTVLCAPSVHGESFGVVLLEAMAAGTPVVASDLPGYRAATDGGRCAVLVAPGDPGALAGALTGLLGDPLLRARLAAGGVERARRFSTEAQARRYVQVYERARSEATSP